MAERFGVGTVAGFEIGDVVDISTWPPTVATVTKLLPMLSESVAEQPISTGQPRRLPAQGVEPGALLSLVSAGLISLQATYNDLEHVWAVALGRMPYSVSTVRRPEEIVPGAYRHTYEIDPTYHSHAWRLNDGVLLDDGIDINQQQITHGVFAVDRGDVVHETNGVSIDTLQFISTNRAVLLNLGVIGHQLNLASITNPDLSGVTKPAWEPVQHVDADIRLGTQSTITPLGTGDRIDVATMRISLANRVVARQTLDSGLYISAPRRGRMQTLTGGINLPRYANDTLYNRARTGEQLMMQAVYTGPEIDATGIDYELGIYLPSVKLVSPVLPTRGARINTQDYTLQISTAPEAQAGMPATIEQSPIIVQLVTDSSVHPLY